VKLLVLLLITAVAVLVWLALSPGLLSATPPPLRLATNIWPGYAPLYMARDLKLLDGRAIRLQEISSVTTVISAFRNHAVDGAAVTLDEALLLVQDGVDARVVLVMDVSHGADAVLGQAGITSLDALRGRRVGVESSALGAYMLSRALARGGLTVADLIVVPLTYDQHEEAFSTGLVDAVVTFDPVRSRLTARGATVLFDSSRIPGEICDVLVVRSEVLRTRRPALAALNRAWYRALNHLATQRSDALERLGRLLDLAPAAVEGALAGIILPPAGEVRRQLTGTQPALLATATRLAQVMAAGGLLRPGIDPATLLDPTLGDLLP
jgi:NitT/TauT family transport system substrate-binding protein